jgi:hypothetical protein
MKKVALSIAALFVLAVVSPAFSQPFADVPTDHWAFDAIAELAAKGLVEGYPDGTFKGDRAMTRYEMAMVVARILARVEAIKIPPPPPPVKIPPPEVTRADIQTLQRLINEFRAELAALGVRVTAVEEELAALRARLDNTKVEGFAFFRYQSDLRNGRNYTYGLFNLTFTGKISSTASATVNMLLSNTCDGGVFMFGSGLTGHDCLGAGVDDNVDGGGYPIQGVTFDRAYLDVTAYGINWRLGRQTYKLGPIGILFNEASVGAWAADSVGIDGLKASASFGPVNLEAAGFTIQSTAGGLGNYSLLMGRASMQLMPGWTLGASLYREVCNWSFCGSTLNSNGWGVDLSGTLIPGITLAAEYAAFTPNTAFAGVMPWFGASFNAANNTLFGISPGGICFTTNTLFDPSCADNTAYQVNAVFNLGQLTGMTQYSPSLTLTYKKAGTSYVPAFSGINDVFGLGYNQGYRAWVAQFSMTFSPLFRPYVNYESGNWIEGAPGVDKAVTELELGFRSRITDGVTARFRYQRRTDPTTAFALGSTDNVRTNRYRLQIDASW